MRNIRKAVHAGYCWGVERAIDMVVQTTETHKEVPVRTLGPIIHNPQVVQALADKGASTIDSLDEMPAGGTVIIRTHGVAPEVYQQAKSRNLAVVDATCPLVTLVQNRAKQLVNEGYHLVIFGNPKHPEVIGTLGHAGGHATVVERPQDARTVKLANKKVGVVVQTTQETERLSEFLSYLAPRCKELKVFNTICNPTIERQDAARDLAKEVQVMIVVGGKNSSNTRHLATVCTQEGAATYHIEEPTEVDPNWFAGVQEIGVTAGASTPGWLMDQVIAHINGLEQQQLLPA
ncbi:MAG: 4-hydroxy-3-methylbut-2-enyl diphosphate reductase [Deltaproteobacteria bacterium]|nr:4-hydroxy-3-methylbut-2-enyl diphosphate reductase [Deltaproteobacteria bacterium]